MILITGSTGLLGSEVVSLCSNSLPFSTKECNLTSLYPSDSIKYHINKNIDCVIHCAARVGGVKANTDQVAQFFDDNIKMNMNVLDACHNNRIKLVAILSTCIYPDAAYVKYPLTEDQLHMGPPHASNFGYAYAKRMMEVQIRAYRQQYGCNFISVIPNNLYGPNDNYDLENGHVVPALIRKFHEAMIHEKKEVVIWGTGEPLREFTFARDAAKIILWLTENYDGPDPINIGNTEEISIKNLAFTIAELVGYEGKVLFDTNKPSGQYEKPSSNKKLLDLGWIGEYTPLRDGLKETIKSFQTRYPNVRGVRIDT